jgi:hypothetical protein
MRLQFLFPAVQAKVTLTSERTRGWRGLQSAPSEAFWGVIMYKIYVVDCTATGKA